VYGVYDSKHSYIAPNWSVGYNADANIFKLNSDGTLAWSECFDSDGEDFAIDLSVDNTGNAYFVIQKGITLSNPNWRPIIQKYSPDGTRLWNVEGTSGKPIDADADDSGNLFVLFSGSVRKYGGGNGALLSSGDIEYWWDDDGLETNPTYWATADCDFIQVASDGTFYVSGTARQRHWYWVGPGDNWEYEYHDNIYTAKLDNNCNVLWRDQYGTYEDEEFPRELRFDNAGNILVTGSASYNLVTLKYSPDGTRTGTYLYSKDDVLFYIDGDYAYTIESSSWDYPPTKLYKYLLSTGAEQWNLPVDGLLTYNFLNSSANGNLYLTGSVYDGQTSAGAAYIYADDMVLIKFDTGGGGPVSNFPDIIPISITIIDGTGPDISYKITVKNDGDAATDGISKIKTRIYLSTDNNITADDTQINDWNFTNMLAPGASKTSYDLTSTVTDMPAGEYYMGVITDAKNVIEESNENNNTLANLVTKITITDGSGEGDDILDIPMAGTAPVIDGSMDDIWYSVANIPLEKQNVTDETAPDDWLDCFASFKMMFDANNFYFFIQAHDDNINTTNTESWANDSFDLFFDGDNSKNDQATGYDANDLQLRYMYGQTTENTGNAPNSACKFKNTDNGYNLEVQIPANDMTFNLEPDHTFGFEIQFNDNDTGSRDHMLKWWAASNDSWLDPSIFGTAKTTDYVADYPMYILQAQSAPTIDGEADEAAWEDIPWFSHNTFIYKENGGPFDPMPDLAQADGWNDCRFNCKLMWQGNMLYFFAQVFDDVIDTSHPDWYMNDAMDLQIDGNNDKGQTTDGNDYQYAFMYTATPSSDAAYTTNSSGWTVEAAMDMASDLGITPGVGHRMGLEVQNNDNDGGGRSLVGRWWSDDNITWSNPSLRGTIELADLIVVDVSEPGAKTAATAFHLAQNYPNPFNPSTTIQYRVPNSCHVTLMIYDLLGKKVTTLVNDTQTPGEYTALWNAQDQANGIYLIRMTAGDYIETRKLILQK